MNQNRSVIYIAIGVGAVIIALVLIFTGILPGRKESLPEPVALEFWGIRDEDDVWRDIIQNFQNENRPITINYQRFDEATYEEILVNRIAEGRGPDIFMLKNEWIAKHRDKTVPLPKEFFNYSTVIFKNTFVDAAVSDLVTPEGDITGVPLFMDSLLLFYNKDMANAAAIAEVPRTWDDVLEQARRLTKVTSSGDIERSGFALGRAQNVEHSFEILSALFLQQQGIAFDRQTKRIALGDRARDALAFYTSFADPRSRNFSWTGRMPNSIDAFAEERVAMVIGFARDLKRLRAKNPHLAIGVAALPQLKDARTPVTYGGYLFLAVSKLSPNAVRAWQFILASTAPEEALRYAQNAALPPARRDIIALGAPQDEFDPSYRQTLFAKNWQVPDERSVRGLFQESIESVSSGVAEPTQAINRLQQRLQQLLP
ncbi:MAG: hypothetical protein A3C07_01280 [Candidatus Sungbacteria bacterium RIFCSPHIGHO2_02_FULL_47_11]|uniref:ABC transporter substrate-binding protein n=1 Tax=Candidatus Sungbacteria bacterium RIFCSPHIGHO2_02_FULL_47_11 TaxID=1802270 RepID=A0A1G2KPP3_9BACT|nr:MAG: hypothetical protein A3C07_01280 [Candidatus Sungbacteria bacterium RIFCSPHIGHO2_02_FULL_47_11]